MARSLALVAAAGLGAAVLARAEGGDYLRHVAFELPFGEVVLLRWPEREMPLGIFLPPPPGGLFEDPDAYVAAVRAGILGWENAAGEKLPRFEFVEKIGDADIPITWAREPDGDWYIAHANLRVVPQQRRFDVAQLLVTARWRDDRIATPEDLRVVVLHEMGHALGMDGHSPDPKDVMYASYEGTTKALSERDRATLAKLYARPIGSRVTGARGGRVR